MLQPWFNMIGLCFDFVGVIILAYEWWIALSAERQEAERAAMEHRLRPHPIIQQQQQANPHQPVFDHMRENLRFQRELQRATSVRGMRGAWFATAMVLIATGFLFQILGSWPGGIGF